MQSGAVGEGFLTGKLNEIYQRVKPIVWILKVTGFSPEKEEIVTYASGFSVKNDGTLMACAHIFSNPPVLNIMARSLDGGDFTEARLLYKRTCWDLALLKVEEMNDSKFGDLALDGSLFEGETLMHIGSPDDFVGSLLVGHAAYKCVEGVTPPTCRHTCGTYNSTALTNTPLYRLMGHVWNSDIFDRHRGQKLLWEKSLDPLIPIIQCAGLTCKGGCSGGPIFSTRGEIVGMLVGDASGYVLAVHVTLLRQFFKEAQSYLEVDPKVKGHDAGEAETCEI